MELLYIWIKDYKNIQNQGFNFSPRWWFEYDVISGILNIDDIIEDVIGDFFGNNIANVTAIIGENGVGKSNLFEFILSKLKDKTGFWDDEFIIIFKDSNKGKIWLHEDLEFFLSYDNKNEFDFEVNSFKMQERDEFGVRGGFNSPNEIDSLQLIYITDAFEGNVKYGGLVNRNFIDMSTDRLVNSSRELSNQLQIKENVFKYEEIKRQAKFLGYFATNLDSVQDIIIPDYLEITSSFRQILKNISAFQKENRNSILLEDERSIIDYFQNKPIYDQVYCELVLSAIYEAMITSSVGEQAFKYFVEKISLLKNDEGYEFIDMGEKIYLISYTEILKFVKSLQDNDRIKIDKGHNSFALPMENVGEFFTTIDSIGYQGRNPFLRYDWQYANAYKYGKLSTGEKALVNLFSRLFVLRH